MNKLQFLLDTNVIIGLLKGHAPSLALFQATQSSMDVMASSQITSMELLAYPSITTEESVAIIEFLSCVQVIAIDAEIEAQTIQLRRTHKIKLPDAIIAATALVRNLELISLDQALIQVVSISKKN